MKALSLLMVIIFLIIISPSVEATTATAWCEDYGYDDLFIYEDNMDLSFKWFYNKDGSVDYIQRRNHGTWSLTRVATDKTVTITEHRFVVFNYDDGVRTSTNISGFVSMTGGNLTKQVIIQAGSFIVPAGDSPVPFEEIDVRRGIFRWEALCDEVIAATN